ncbi:hypothetical protein J2T57_003999 [Natronocella acetinitrilica]|uniref:Uncharacterized protein n=1 Tax=Natronocella acetinitrilica TaxID=414046 RepID=A0AAE3G8Q8_9GAMM|nr:hypothetical protein [Natronocella acetinitrilica]
MRVIREIELSPVQSVRPGGPPRSEVRLFGLDTGPVVSGAELDAAIDIGNGECLLFLTDDIPHEDVLNIHLITADGRRLDSAAIGYPYATEAFSLLEIEPPNRVHFRFMGETQWTVEILPRRELRLPLISEPRGVWRGARMFRRFRVDGAPCHGP